MGLLDSLFDQSTYGGDGGLLSRLAPMLAQPPQSQGFPQQQPQALGRQFDQATFDPQTYAPNQAQPIGVGGYQMPGIGSAVFYNPQQANIPPNAQPAQGQMPQAATVPQQPMQQPMQLPPALGGGNYIDNLRGGAGLIGSLFGGSSQQKNLKAQYDSLVPVLGPQKALLAVMNPEAGKTLLSEALTNKEKWGEIGSDSFGNKQYGWINERDQTINGKSAGEGGDTSGSTTGFLAPGTKQIDSSLKGEDYLKQFSPEVQQAAKDYVAGKATPTGNPRKGFTQTVQMIARKYGADIGESVDDATYAARRTMRNQLSSSAPASLGGQINIGNTAAGHLADLSQKALDLGNYDTGIAPLSGLVNSARGLGTEQAAKMEALKGAAQHYGQENNKFYAGSPGGTAE